MDFPKKRVSIDCSNSSNKKHGHRRRRIRKPHGRITYGRILTCSLSVMASLSLLLLYCISVSFPATRKLRTTPLPPHGLVPPPPTPPIQPKPKPPKRNILPISQTSISTVQQQLNHFRSHAIAMPQQQRPISSSPSATSSPVPIVIMAYNRLDYLQQSIDSLLQSDFPRQHVPLIVSVDGHIPDVLQYLETLQIEFPLLQVWIHPFACADHPNDFPMQVTTPDYGDTYGNPRRSEITCCKHHFTWLVQETFTTESLTEYDTFFFLEEDYIVAPTVYETIQQGIHAMNEFSIETDFLGVALDPTNGRIVEEPVNLPDHVFYAQAFQTGPMTLHRAMYQKLVDAAHNYCTMDESNWDWSLVQLTLKSKLPHTMLFPSRGQVRHIGLDHGMHEHLPQDIGMTPLSAFHATAVYGSVKVARTVRPKQMSGGWGHIEDQAHCLQLLSENTLTRLE